MEKPSVAVLPFTSKNSGSLMPEERGVREFEKTFLAAELIGSINNLGLRSKIWSAYFSPNATPAADLIVRTDIRESNGNSQVLDVEVYRANGTKAWARGYHLGGPPDTLGKVWGRIAQDVADTKQLPGEYASTRVQGYLGTPALANDKQADLAREAKDVELKAMLLPATNQVWQRAMAADQIYLTWWKTSGPLVSQRSAEKVNEGLGIATMLLGGVAEGLNARAGNTVGVQQSANTVVQGANVVNEASANIDQLNQTLAKLAHSFTYWQGKPIAVRVFGKVYNFTGSMASQQAQLHKVVQTELAKAGG